MFCANCGEKIKEGGTFCAKCGAKAGVASEIAEGEEQSVQKNEQEQQSEKKSSKQAKKAEKPARKKKGIIRKIIWIFAALMLVAVVGVSAIIYIKNRDLNQQKETLSTSVQGYGMERYNEKLNSILIKWDELSLIDFDEKRIELRRIKKVLKDAAEDEEFLAGWRERLASLEAAKASYASFESFPKYEAALKACSDVISAKDVDNVEAAFENVNAMLQIVMEEAEDEEFLAEWSNKLADLESAKAYYDLSEYYSEYEAALGRCAEVLSARDVDNVEAAFENANMVLQNVIAENEEIVAEKLAQYGNVDLNYAEDSEREAYESGIDQIQKLVEEGNYKDLEELFASMDEITYPLTIPEKELSLHVQQIDVSEYPNMKLYVQIEDAATGEVPGNLDQTLFYIGKEDANGDYVKQTISRVSQLNQIEALSINLVADVSGSMWGTPLDEAKETMSNFVNSVQFNAGDRIELITFSTGVYLEREFCSDASLLISDIYGLQCDDMTSLYDALYTAVTRTAAQHGARCVMAFTDGVDNYSNCDMNDVIEVAQRYKVPIFIIGIGSVNSYEASYIASETGGEYYSISEVKSMEEIYENIYRQQKEMFLLEFADSSNDNMEATSDIVIRYRSPEYFGESYQSYTPNILLSVDEASFYKSGPEEVVEAYMKGFDEAMTYSDFSYIESYLLKDSPIYQTQKKYVMKKISEALDSYEIVDVVYSGSEECVVKTRETYYVQVQGKPLVLLTQECQYLVVYTNMEWKIKDFADRVKVLSKIKQ